MLNPEAVPPLPVANTMSSKLSATFCDYIDNISDKNINCVEPDLRVL